MTGLPYDDPRVRPFDGKSFTYTTFGLTKTVTILTQQNKWWLTAKLTAKKIEPFSSMTYIEFQSASIYGTDIIGVLITKTSFSVSLNGKPFTPKKQAIKGGTLNYIMPVWGKDHILVLKRSGVSIRITQPFDAAAVKYKQWLNANVILADPKKTGWRGILAPPLLKP